MKRALATGFKDAKARMFRTARLEPGLSRTPPGLRTALDYGLYLRVMPAL